MKKVALAACAALLVSMPAMAEDNPRQSGLDPRIRYVTYNSTDVVQLDGVIGIATHIVLEEGETYVTHAFGDAEAWSFAVERNHIFLKPRADHADTNLIVVTDRRSYNFKLNYRPTRNAAAVYELAFRYPQTVAKVQQAVVDRAAADAAFKAQRGTVNLKYTMAGDYALAPVNTWDNGTFTYFKFPGNRDIPSIYMVDADGKEVIVNRNSVGPANETIVVQRVSPKWYLRLGSQALAVFNEAFDPYGVPNDTGTTSPYVERTIKEGAQ